TAGFGEDPNAQFKHQFKPTQHADSFSKFVVFVPMRPGRYEVTDVAGVSFAFPTTGSFFLPVQKSAFDLPPHRVLYLGRVEAVNRERRNDQEPRSGPVIPLVDQSVSGFSGGTFDLRILDNADADIAMLRAGVPLGERALEKALLSLK